MVRKRSATPRGRAHHSVTDPSFRAIPIEKPGIVAHYPTHVDQKLLTPLTTH